MSLMSSVSLMTATEHWLKIPLKDDLILAFFFLFLSDSKIKIFSKSEVNLSLKGHQNEFVNQLVLH